MQESKDRGAPQRSGLVNLRTLRPGERVILVGNIIAEIVDNPGDGYWLTVRRVDGPAGEADLVYANDVVSLA